MGQNVFISYASVDRETVSKVHKVLSEAHFDVWFDVRKLESGEPLHHEILSQIQPDTAFVLMHSKSSSQSHWVKKELSTALNSRPTEAGGIFLVLLDDTPLPEELQDIKFVDLQSPKEVGQELNKLVRGVFKWSKKSHLYSTENTQHSSMRLILEPSLMAPFMAMLMYAISETFSILPALNLFTEKIPIATTILILIYGVMAGPALALASHLASLHGTLKSTGYTKPQLASLYKKQQRKLLFYFTWMGLWIPFLLNPALALMMHPDHGAAPAYLVASFFGPFFVTGIGVILMKRYPGPVPLLP